MATFQNRDKGGITAKIRMKGFVESKTFYSVDKPTPKTAKKQAEEWVNLIESQITLGLFKACKTAKTVTLSEALDKHEKDVSKVGKNYDAEKYQILRFHEWKYSKNKLSELTYEKFIEYRDLRRESVSDSTIRKELALIGSIFKHTDYGISNPAEKVSKTLAAGKKRDRRLKKVEQEYLLEQVFDTKCSDSKRANRYIPLVMIFATETSCRLCEIVKDTKEHTTGILIENLSIQKESGKSFAKIFNTKNGKDRLLPLTESAVEAIERAISLHNSSRGAVFKTTAGAIKQSWARAKMRARKKYAEDIKLDELDKNFLVDFRFHDLRHEAASRWKKYFSTLELKDLTGHLDTRSLARYLNATEEDIEEMSEKMSAIQIDRKEKGDTKADYFPKPQ